MIDLKQTLLVTYRNWTQLEYNENLIPVICWALPKANDFHKGEVNGQRGWKGWWNKEVSIMNFFNLV